MRRLAVLLLAGLAAAQDGRAEIEALVAAVARAEEGRDPAALADRFDVAAFLQEVRAQGFVPGDAVIPPDVLDASLPQITARVPFRGARVRRVHLEGDARGVVVLDHRLVGDAPARARWFLRKGEDGWRFFDAEIVDLAMRLSTMVGIGIEAARTGDRELEAHLRRLQQAYALAQEERYEEAAASLEGARVTDVPRIIEAVRQVFLAAVRLGLEEPEAALGACERAEALQPGIPVVLLIRATCLNGLGRREEALSAGRKYVELVGESADALVQIGDALLNLGRHAEAETAYRAGLAEDPQSDENVLGLALALPAERKAEIREAFAKLADRRASFRWMASSLLEWEEWDALRALVAAIRGTDPVEVWAEFYDAAVLLNEGKHGDAAALARAAVPRIRQREDQEIFVELYLDAMIAAGKPVDALRTAPDRAFAFAYLAAELAYAERADELESVLAARTEDADAGELLHLWRVELAWMRGRYAEVAEIARLHAAGIRELESDDQWRLADRWMRSLVRLGRKDEALKEARSIALEEGDSYYLVLAYASLGQPDEAIAAFERCMGEGYEAAELYEDADIGPLLTGDAYRMLRLKYPPPSED